MRIILVLVWTVLNWLKSGASVGCGENDGLKWVFRYYEMRGIY